MALDTFSADADARLSAAKAELAQAKSRRDALRGSAALSPEQAQALTRESQFQKAEFHRLKLSLAAQSQTLQFKVQSFSNRLAQLKTQRENQSLSLQMWLFNHTQVSNSLGQSASLPQLFVSAPQGVPPSGAGECCAPKLLQYAFSHHLHPLAMAEFWWGRSPKGEVRSQGLFYPACQSKCQPTNQPNSQPTNQPKGQPTNRPKSQPQCKAISVVLVMMLGSQYNSPRSI